MIFMTDANGNLVNIANDNQGNTSGLQMDLLWENSSPTSSFAEQTITVQGLSNYKLFVVFCELDTEYPNFIQPNLVVPNIQSNLLCSVSQNNRRLVKIENNSIIFSYGYTMSNEQMNQSCIPKYIYGIK